MHRAADRMTCCTSAHSRLPSSDTVHCAIMTHSQRRRRPPSSPFAASLSPPLVLLFGTPHLFFHRSPITHGGRTQPPGMSSSSLRQQQQQQQQTSVPAALSPSSWARASVPLYPCQPNAQCTLSAQRTPSCMRVHGEMLGAVADHQSAHCALR